MDNELWRYLCHVSLDKILLSIKWHERNRTVLRSLCMTVSFRKISARFNAGSFFLFCGNGDRA